VKFHAQKQIGKGHVIDIFTSEDMENISLYIFQFLTLYYIIIIMTFTSTVFTRLSAAPDRAPSPNERRIWDQIFLKSAAPEWAPH
jgi:hypothetical protein